MSQTLPIFFIKLMNMIKQNRNYLTIFCLLLLVLPSLVHGECTCEADEQPAADKSRANKYKIVAIAAILIAGAIGVCLPLIGSIIPEGIFFLVKSFAAGVILSTGFIHVLPDAFENLTSPCLDENPWQKFPFTGFVAMVCAIGALMIDAFATSYYSRQNLPSVTVNLDEEKVEDNEIQIHTHATHGHSHGVVSVDNSVRTDLLRHRVISQVLELGIVVHSVIIGISLGASKSPTIIKPLIAALTFHQFFEGMGLGGCIFQAKLKTKTIAIMSLFFSLTTPIGIAIGIAISNSYDENSPKALIVQGIFRAASAGILIYMALVDLLAADFMNAKVLNNGKLQLGVNFFLLFGAACMSILAIWA